MKVRDYKAEYFELQDLIENHDDVNQETGEVTDNSSLIEELRADLQKDGDNLIDFFCDIRREAESDASQLQEEISRLQKRKKALVNKADGAKYQVGFISGGLNVKTLNNTVYWSARTSLEIIDESLVPSDFIAFTPKIDKTGLKRAIVNGLEVDGITLVDKLTVGIR